MYTTYKMNKSQPNLTEFDGVVADECHILKDKASETTQATNEANAFSNIGLASTAIQNNFPMERIEEETLSDYRTAQFYTVHVGEILKSPGAAYEVVGKRGYGRNSTVWPCRDLSDTSFYTIKDELPDKEFPEYLLKPLLVCLLNALDFLHTEAGVIHTDIQARNIILSLVDETPLVDFINAERDLPCARKVIDARRTIYTSRAIGFSTSNPILCDFGLSVFGIQHEGQIQPLPFRAPEVILGTKWDSKVDIWNLGVLTWSLFFNAVIFDGTTAHDQLETMIAQLGPPTLEFLQRSEASKEYFDKHGVWKGPAIIHSPLEEIIEGGEPGVFLDFVRSMVAWAPEDRKTAAELLKHPWLCKIVKVGEGEDTAEAEL